MRARAATPVSIDRRHSRSRWTPAVPLLALAMVVGACSPAASGPTAPGTVGPSAGSVEPSAAASPPESATPSAEPTETPTAEPTIAPTDSPEPTATGTVQPSPPPGSPSAGAADRCFGSNDTKDFFNSFAQEVPWPAYCAVLPTGWSVEKGTYRLKNGGRLTISYRRRADGARIVLDEGAVCQETTPCVPAGTDLGQIAFGDRQATLVDTGTTGLVAAVDQTENPAWLLTGTGIDKAAFTAIAAKLALIDQ